MKSLINLFSQSLFGLAACACVATASAQTLPLKQTEGIAARDHWVPDEVNRPGLLEAMQQAVGGPGKPVAKPPAKPVRIALVYPSADVSDFWLRQYQAMTARLKELKIPFETTQFASRQIEHELQTTYTDRLLQDADRYDYVIFGPSELATQADNLSRLVKETKFKTMVWAFHTPLKQFGNKQPYAWFDFSSAAGAQVMCDFMVKRMGPTGSFALVRGIPGITDNQRSGDFSKCFTSKTQWKMVYQHYGQFQREGGYQATELILSAYPEVSFIHSANTAMAMGAMSSVQARSKGKSVLLTGWGGTGEELQAIRLGELNATPMRMSDDVGAATAEAIKLNLEGRAAEMPLVFLGRIAVAHDKMSKAELDALEKEAFRYSGVGAVKR